MYYSFDLSFNHYNKTSSLKEMANTLISINNCLNLGLKVYKLIVLFTKLLLAELNMYIAILIYAV